MVLKAYNPQTASNSTTLQTYNFIHSYFGPAFATDPNVLRLRLDGISVTGNTSATSTPLTLAGFGYNETVDQPNRTLPLADYWGYCNMTSPNLDIGGRNYLANPATIQADILTSVTDMEGGGWQINYEPNTYGGTAADGVRVNQITQTSQAGSLSKTYQYVDKSGNSTGEIIAATYQILSFQLGNGFLDLYSSPFVYNDVNGVSLGYSHVKETNSDGGYTIYSFTNFNDVPDLDTIGFNDAQVVQWSNSFSPFPLSVLSDDLSAKHGLLTDVSVFKANGDQVTETANTYAPVTHSTRDGYGIRGFTYAVGAISNSCRNIYYTPIENYRLTKTVQTDFDQATPLATPLVTTTNYTYDPTNNRQPWQVSTLDSKGQNHVQTIFHADDLPNNSPSPQQIPMVTSSEVSAIVNMLAGNNTSAVIHSVDDRNSTKTQVHNSFTNIVSGPVNHVYPVNRAVYASDPVNTTLTLTKQAFYNYDFVSSNLTSSNLTGDISTSAQYLYNSSIPVALVTNATGNEFFYQGFEETGGNVTTSAYTGNRSFSGSYTVPFTIPNGRSYLIQWWSYTGSWVFNQQAYTGPMNLNGLIDDVRVFPKDALMTTCTYNPLVGKTSETDPSGKSVVSQYDGLNRLQTILDQDGNVLKQYDYKYQILLSTGSSGLVLTGVPGYSSGGPTTGQGTITGPPGYVVTVTMNAAGSPGSPCGLNVQVTGAVSNGPTSVTNGTASFTFVMPVSGSVSWFASLVPTGPGGGSFSIH